MKPTILILLFGLSFAANGVLWRRLTTIEKQRTAQADDYPLGETMGHLQRYADKLWLAGEAGNWEFAEVYRGEVAETEASTYSNNSFAAPAAKP